MDYASWALINGCTICVLLAMLLGAYAMLMRYKGSTHWAQSGLWWVTLTVGCSLVSGTTGILYYFGFLDNCTVLAMPNIKLLSSGFTLLTMMPVTHLFVQVFNVLVKPKPYRRILLFTHAVCGATSLSAISLYLWDRSVTRALCAQDMSLCPGDAYNAHSRLAQDLWYIPITVQTLYLGGVLLVMLYMSTRRHKVFSESEPEPVRRRLKVQKIHVLPVIVLAYSLSLMLSLVLKFGTTLGGHPDAVQGAYLCANAFECTSLTLLVYPSRGTRERARQKRQARAQAAAPHSMSSGRRGVACV
ncbi:hypothetical protein KIPB_001407 [Kipferlia bialata]|uniref:Uncharacterized protein n=1 Tax=Kipferlia bialata TaxID=797122 RepID=A0A9K3CQ08_9EUKA|nr:hypothetical protein KIPB_001407 [Kipferlia bialata]|eukprot:g1407.t1